MSYFLPALKVQELSSLITYGVAPILTAAVRDVGNIQNPVGFVNATVTSPLSGTVIPEIASVRVFPEPVNAPFVAPVTVMRASNSVLVVVKVSPVKVRVIDVVGTKSDPFAATAETYDTCVSAIHTGTVRDVGVMLNPLG